MAVSINVIAFAIDPFILFGTQFVAGWMDKQKLAIKRCTTSRRMAAQLQHHMMPTNDESIDCVCSRYPVTYAAGDKR